MASLPSVLSTIFGFVVLYGFVYFCDSGLQAFLLALLSATALAVMIVLGAGCIIFLQANT